MKRRSVAFVSTVTLLTVTAFALGQSSGKSAPPSEEEMMKRLMAAATPGPAHKKLAALAGKWKVTDNAPASKEAASLGVSESKWVMGGRFLMQQFRGEMMGQKMEGLGYTGYDNLKKKYVMCWMDSFGTSIVTATGDFDKAGKVLTMTGVTDDPMTGERDIKVKYVTTIVSGTKNIFAIYDHAGSKNESKMMGMTNTKM